MKSSSSDQTIEHYNKMAKAYENRWVSYLDHTHRRFLAKIEFMLDDDIMLDLSCGTGLLAKHIIERGDSFAKLILNDIATDMQAHARKRFEDKSAINFTSFSAESIEQPNNHFDKIFSLNSFHNYPQQSQVLKECHRVLKPGGHLYLLDWNRSGPFRLKNRLIKMLVPERIDTRSAREIKTMLNEQHFEINYVDEWYHGSWKFYYIVGEKK